MFATRACARLCRANASRGLGRAPGVAYRARPVPHSAIWKSPANSIVAQSRGLHNGGNGSSQNWDGIVYHFMDNLQGKVKHGPSCFVRDDDSDEKKRDMRQEVPLKLNRSWLRHTAEAIDIRMRILAGDMDDTDEWQTMMKLVRLCERLSKMSEDDPLLDFDEYKEIWDTVRAAQTVEAEFPITLFSVAEKVELARIMAVGGAMYRAASCNAAFRGVRGEKIEQELDEEEDGGRDLNSLAMNIYGGLLDGKDFFGDRKWFSKDEDVAMLKAINQLRAESRKRG